jgi:hypothetical protein
LDGSSAWELRHAIGDLGPKEVVLDFEGISEVWDFGAAVLSAGLRALRLRRIELVDAPEEVLQWLDRYSIPATLRPRGKQMEVQSGHLSV